MINLISMIISLVVAGLEAFSYSGFIAKHIGISAAIFYLISFVLSSRKYSVPKIMKLGIIIINFIISAIYLYLLFLEKTIHPNYVYTYMHINLLTFLFFVALLWFHALRLNDHKILKSLLIASLIYISLDGAGRTLALAYGGVQQVIASPFISYEEKMALAYPGFYPAMQEVKKLTPSNSTILIPPQGNPWELEGNAAMVTYFIYPRKVRNLLPEELSHKLPENTFLLIARGSWERKGDTDYGWPKVSVKAVRIWQIDLTNKLVNMYERDYDPNKDQWDWGLIEVKND